MFTSVTNKLKQDGIQNRTCSSLLLGFAHFSDKKKYQSIDQWNKIGEQTKQEEIADSTVRPLIKNEHH